MCPNVTNHNDQLLDEKTALKPGRPCLSTRRSRFSVGFGKLMKCSEKGTSSQTDSCILFFDVVLQDVCANVRLYLDMCYVPFFFQHRDTIAETGEEMLHQ